MAVEELTYEQLQDLSSGKDFSFKTTNDVTPLREIVGQDRAVRALEFGLGIRSSGFNLYVAGVPGTGRRHVIERFLGERAPHETAPPDWCYVHNFNQPDRPMAIEIPSGMGPELARDVEKLLGAVERDLARAFESEAYQEEKKQVMTRFRSQRDAKQKELADWLQQRGLGLQQTPYGVGVAPLGEDGKPMSREEFEQLPEQRREEIQSLQASVQGQLEQMVRQVQRIDGELREAVGELDERVTRRIVDEHLEALREKYCEQKKVCVFFDAMCEDMVQNIDLFRNDGNGNGDDEKPQNPMAALARGQKEARLQRYQVNCLVTNDPEAGAPVIYEPNPTHPNLFGRIERRYTMGALVTDHTMLKSGAMQRAAGGYLVVSVIDVLTRPGAWEALKRAIELGEVRMEDLGQALGLGYTETLRPEPIPMKAKVILYGNPTLYHMLYALDEDFRNLFKVKAEFGVDMDRSAAALEQLAAFIARQTQEDGLLPFDPSAVAAVANEASRMIDDREKIGTQFTRIDDVLQEANHWARQARATTVSAKFVERAIAERTHRSNLAEERMREMIERGTLMVETRGKAVGQVNGLSVYQVGDYAFGLPSRVTANVHLGTGGVVHIERRAELSGPIHTKGVEIMSALLAERFCQDRPLALSASLTFEQSYGGVEGDSASAAEFFALLSALAEAPVTQSIAMTGSVNQKGQMQPIGGATRKVEGFFDTCRIKGLTGRQGVLLPRSNVKNLVLRKDVLEAIRKGRFHIWAADTVDDGIELLTGIPAGKRSKRGTWTENSIGARVDARLQLYAEKARKFAAEGRKGTDATADGASKKKR